MSWRTRFRRRKSLIEGLWAIPILGALLGVILGLAVSIADERLSTPLLWQYSPSTASAVLTSIVGATAALTGFVVTVTVLVVQMATGTFSARIMRLWFRDPLLKATLAILVGTLTYSFSVLSRIGDDFVPNLGVTLSGVLVSLCLLAFIVFFDRCIRRLRPAAVAADVARTAHATFEQMVSLADRADIRWEFASMRADPTLSVGASRGGAIQAIDPDGLVAWARAHGAELVLPHPVGDFVHTGEAVVLVFGGEFGDGAAAELEGMIALGDERTFDQDPTFALRMMVDIANKALSPAVNDPTTAVQVLDHIGEVLGFDREDGLRAAREGRRTGRCGHGRDHDAPLGGRRDDRAHGDPRVRCDVGAGHAAAPGAYSRNSLRPCGPSTELPSKTNSAVLMRPSPPPGATPSTSIARARPIARASAGSHRGIAGRP